MHTQKHVKHRLREASLGELKFASMESPTPHFLKWTRTSLVIAARLSAGGRAAVAAIADRPLHIAGCTLKMVHVRAAQPILLRLPAQVAFQGRGLANALHVLKQAAPLPPSLQLDHQRATNARRLESERMAFSALFRPPMVGSAAKAIFSRLPGNVAPVAETQLRLLLFKIDWSCLRPPHGVPTPTTMCNLCNPNFFATLMNKLRVAQQVFNERILGSVAHSQLFVAANAQN